MTRMIRGLAAVMLALLVLAAGPARAQGDYPSRPIRIVIGFAPGGLADITMRLVGQKLSERVGQQVIIDNKPGAGGVTAANAAKTGRPDGYTLLVYTNGTAISQALFKQLGFDPMRDFVPISIVAYFDLLVLTKADSPMRTMADVLAKGRQPGGAFNIGTINPGSTQNLTGELFKSSGALQAVVVPYRGTPDVLTALVRGDIDIAIESYAALKGPIDDGQIRAVAASGEARSAMLPQVPTVHEAGLPGFNVTGWNALMAPAGTPPEIVALLNRHIRAIVETPEIARRLLELGTEARASTPEELGRRFAADVEKWNAVIDKAGIQRQ